MALSRPENSQPERILVYGPIGAGKSYSVENIMVWTHRTHSPAQFYCLVSDNGLLDSIESLPDLQPLFHPFPVFDYPDYIDAMAKILPVVTTNDWLVCDLVGDVWDAAQRHFTEQVFGTSKANYFLQARLAMQLENEEIAKYNAQLPRGAKEEKYRKKSDTFDGWKDWSVINSMHKEFMDMFALRSGCNVFAISQADILMADDQEERENIDTYGRFGVKPHGQKFIGHYFRTILLAGRDRNRWLVNTVRDRRRTELVGETVKDFAITYLKGVAGWHL